MKEVLQILLGSDTKTFVLIKHSFFWILLLYVLPGQAFARSKNTTIQFGVARGLTFYTAPELKTFNERLGNSPRLTVEHEFGRALTHSGHIDFLYTNESWSLGFEGQQWAETLRGSATSAESNPRSEATLAFLRLWFTGGVRLWPWVGPVIVKNDASFLGHRVVMNKTRPLGSGFFSFLKFASGPLLWRHDYLLSDDSNQTLIDYVTRSLAWDVGLRWSFGWRVGHVFDVGLDASTSTTFPIKGESAVGNNFLLGRNNSDKDAELNTKSLSRSAWRSSQILVFVKFFY